MSPRRRLDPPDGGRWGLVLAGGDGVRLRGLTRRMTGDDRPKQFCRLIGPETMLERTWRRAALEIPPARILMSLNREHERFYRPLLAGMPACCTVVQPMNRGTAPAILHGVLRVAAAAPTAAVAIVPSDHYVDDDHAFMRHVAAAFRAVEARPDLLVLLGIAPDSAESEYGWIEPGERIGRTPVLRVRDFREKPAEDVAHAMMARGGLWNSLVVVARVPALLGVFRRSAPELARAFAVVQASFGTYTEIDALRQLYAHLAPSSFSDVVLASRPANLAVLPVTGVPWSDWGQPRRVMATLDRLGVRPEWFDRVTATA
jgi:mannose-1-phosphate guanylyltransferase